MAPTDPQRPCPRLACLGNFDRRRQRFGYHGKTKIYRLRIFGSAEQADAVLPGQGPLVDLGLAMALPVDPVKLQQLAQAEAGLEGGKPGLLVLRLKDLGPESAPGKRSRDAIAGW